MPSNDTELNTVFFLEFITVVAGFNGFWWCRPGNYVVLYLSASLHDDVRSKMAFILVYFRFTKTMFSNGERVLRLSGHVKPLRFI